MREAKRTVADRIVDSLIDLIVHVPLDFVFLLAARWAGAFEAFGWSNPTTPQLFSIAIAFYVAQRH